MSNLNVSESFPTILSPQILCTRLLLSICFALNVFPEMYRPSTYYAISYFNYIVCRYVVIDFSVNR